MSDNVVINTELKSYAVWDRTTRLFHWINVLCIIGLIGAGTALLNDDALGISKDGKFLLKSVHAYIGYVFAVNLVWRLVWGFIGNKFARWKAISPFGRGSWQSLKEYISSVKSGKTITYLGHNPLGKLMIACLFLLITIQTSTGLILAGTDLYLPPFGHEIAEWVTGEGEEHNKIVNLKPGSKDNIDTEAYAQMRSFRKPVITTHVYTFYTLLLAIILHIAGVVVAEIRENNGLVSAMFSGKKVVAKKPVDLE